MVEHERSEDEWRTVLSPEQFEVLRLGRTEPAYSGEHCERDDDGVYRCAACRAELFSSDHKQASTRGWPSFSKPVEDEAVTSRFDGRNGLERVEVRCATCDSHLGHVFTEPSAGADYCINSVALEFEAHDD